MSPTDTSIVQNQPTSLDDLDHLVHAVALATGEVDELSGSLDDGSTLGRPCNRDAAPAPKLEQPLVAQ